MVFGAVDLSGSIDLADPVNGADLFIQGAATFDSLGELASGAGDVNGDGIDDLLIGAPNASRDGRDYAGASYVVFGAVDLSGTIDLADPVNGADLFIQGAATFDSLGELASGAGDVNGDGIDDLLIGAPNASRDGRDYAGASYVVFGAVDLSGTIDLADPVNGPDLFIQGAATFDFLGKSASGAGDVNGDGMDDLFIGASNASRDDRDHAGASYVVFGAMDLSSTIDLADPVNGVDLLIQGGSWVSGADDVNGDGIDDLIIGDDLASADGRDYAGASYVVFGGPAAPIERLIAGIEAAGLPREIENSLTKKLSNAQGSLARSQINGAISKIGAFINLVEAQRGEQIDEADADAWIAAAQRVNAMSWSSVSLPSR